MVSEKIKLYNKTSIQYWRTPQIVLQEIIKNRTYESIGGNIQLAINSKYDFNLYAISCPVEGEESSVTLKFRNLDLFDEVGTNVGECRISINGIHIN